MNKSPQVGVGVIIRNKDKVLLLRRNSSHGAGSWAFIGGHLEFGETPEECAKREVYEEIRIKIKNPRVTVFTNDFFKKEKKHYITLYVVADYAGDKIEVQEPDKIEKVGWYEWRKFPKPLFVPLINLLKTDFSPFKV